MNGKFFWPAQDIGDAAASATLVLLTPSYVFLLLPLIFAYTDISLGLLHEFPRFLRQNTGHEPDFDGYIVYRAARC